MQIRRLSTIKIVSHYFGRYKAQSCGKCVSKKKIINARICFETFWFLGLLLWTSIFPYKAYFGVRQDWMVPKNGYEMTSQSTSGWNTCFLPFFDFLPYR